MGRHSMRVSRAGVLAVAATAVLAAGGTAAYSLGGRRSPAAAHVPAVAEPALVAVTLRASLPRPAVRYGGAVTVTGLLRDAAGAPLPGRSVEVLAARADAPANAAVVATPMTDGRGRLAATFRPAAGSAVWLRFAGASGLEAGESPQVRLTVAPQVTLRARTTRAGGRWTTTLRGVVKPGKAGQPVRLDRRTPAGWRPVSTARLAKAGGYAFTVTTTRPGAYEYRVVRPGAGAFAAGTATGALRLRAPRPKPSAVRAGNGGPADLLVTGDSFAYYLGQQLSTARTPRQTTVESRPSSGLARPDYFDWAARAKAQAATRPGAVVVFLGANDCQPIRVHGTGRWVTVGSSTWVAEYRRRAAELMRVYSSGGARPVYWVGLPIAQRADIAACYRSMNAATAAATRDVRGATWVDSWSLYAVKGKYSVRVGGVVARQDDGIHLTFEGTRFLTRKVYALLRP